MSCTPCEERQARLLSWANGHTILLLVASLLISAYILTPRRTR